VAAYPLMKAADPAAVVLAGGSGACATGNGNYNPRDWLDIMYSHGAKGYFDGLAHHPYCWSGDFTASQMCPLAPNDWNMWTIMFQDYPSPDSIYTTDGRSLRTIMSENGEPDKAIWMTEFGAPSSDQSYLDETNQARELQDAYTWLSTQRGDWYGPLFWYEFRDPGYVINPATVEYFGLERADSYQKQVYGLFTQLSVAAASPSPSPSPSSTMTPTTSPTPTPKPSSTSVVTPTTTATPAPVLGDMNSDNRVNIFDVSYLLSKWGTADSRADLNHNGIVDIFDLSKLLSVWTG
jgi:hypothetical protein